MRTMFVGEGSVAPSRDGRPLEPELYHGTIVGYWQKHSPYKLYHPGPTPGTGTGTSLPTTAD